MNEMTNDTTLSKMTIADLAGVYSIPSYQRGYRWTEDEITALLNDLAEYAESGDSDGYCLQPLVLQPMKDSDGRIAEGKYLVVDGQQRLTTLYIIFNILNCGEEMRWDIEYTTEKNKRLSELLKHPGTSINDHFRGKALEIAGAWRENNAESAQKVQPLFSSGNVFFLRYLIDPEEDGHVVFQRLNAGKTPLTSSELIRALFLESDNGLRDDERNDIAKEWDMMTSDMGDDMFWAIWNTRRFDKIPTRIDFLFSMVCGCPLHVARLSPLAIYLKFEKWMKKLSDANKAERLRNAWEEVLRCHWWMQSCFADPETRLCLGWVFEFTQNQAYVLFRDIWIGKAKRRLTAFRQAVTEIIRDALKDVDDIGSLRYGDELLKSVFVLLNGLAAIDRNENFRFDLYRKYSWDIEHIASQTENPLEDTGVQKEWLSLAEAEMPPKDREILSEKKSFEDKWKLVWERFKPKDEDDKIRDEHDVGNLALLDSGTNRAYKNAIFPAKRRRILQTVRELAKQDGTPKYVPPLTEEAFSKVYSPFAAQMRYWGQSDADNYKTVLSRLFKNFMEKGE